MATTATEENQSVNNKLIFGENKQLAGKVRDVMTREVMYAHTTTSVSDVADKMAARNLRRIVIVDDQRHVRGVISQRDILRGYLDQQNRSEDDEKFDWNKVEIETLIHREKAVTVSPDLPLHKAAVVIGTNKIGCLPVVNKQGELQGVLSTTDLLRHVTGRMSDTVEAAFQFYTPATEARGKMPAYIRKISGELVVPLKCMDRPEALTEYVLLGYDPPTGRVLIKFVADDKKTDEALKTRLEEGCLVIAASGFVAHFDLRGKITAFDVSIHQDNLYVVLSPRQTF